MHLKEQTRPPLVKILRALTRHTRRLLRRYHTIIRNPTLASERTWCERRIKDSMGTICHSQSYRKCDW